MDKQELRRCKDDPGYFSSKLLALDPWTHQQEILNCLTKIIVVAAARQTGKSVTAQIKALYTAFCERSKVIICSPSQRQSSLMFEEIKHRIEESDILRGSGLKLTKTTITLSNGSEIWCLPDSPSQIRGFSGVKLIILDEANFASSELLRAVQYSMLTVPDSQLLMISTPFSEDHFFHRYYQDGLKEDQHYIKSFHYDYTVSPLIKEEDINFIKAQKTDSEFRCELLAEFASPEGSYFSRELIMSSVRDYSLIEPEEANGLSVVAGVDWGKKADHSVVMLLSRTPCNRFYIPFFQVFRGVDYFHVIKRIKELSTFFNFEVIHPEENGVGSFPCELLGRELSTNVQGVFTTAKVKVDGFSKIEGLLRDNKLILPRDSELIRQLCNLRYSLTEAGTMTIHHSSSYARDDLPDALMLALVDQQTEPAILCRILETDEPQRQRFTING